MPPREYHFYVYILANRSRDLYIGFTDNLHTRVAQHRELRPGTYTARYEITRLIYFEHFKYANNAINREKSLRPGHARRRSRLPKPPIQPGRTSRKIGSRRCPLQWQLPVPLLSSRRDLLLYPKPHPSHDRLLLLLPLPVLFVVIP